MSNLELINDNDLKLISAADNNVIYNFWYSVGRTIKWMSDEGNMLLSTNRAT